MAGPSLAEATPPPDPETVRRLLALLQPPASTEQLAS